MADSSQYKIELVSAESDSGDSTVVRGITYKPSTSVRRQKHHRRPSKELEKCENWKKFGISVCILLVSAVILWILVLSLLLSQLFKTTVELQRVSRRTTVQTDELSHEMQKWHNFSKSIEKDQSQRTTRISRVEHELSNLTLRLAKLEKRLVAVEERESRSQMFSEIQEQVRTLTSSIAGLGSEVESLKSELAGFRDDEDNKAQLLSHLKANVTDLAKTVSNLNETMCQDKSTVPDNLMNASIIISNAIQYIRPEINTLNESLSKRIRYLSEDQERDHKLFIELQESLANVSSQVISLIQNGEDWKTNFNNLELKILTIREKFNAISAKTDVKVTVRHHNVESTTSSLYDSEPKSATEYTKKLSIKPENEPTTIICTKPASPEVDNLLPSAPTKCPVTG